MKSLRYGGWFFLMLLLVGCSSAPSRPALTEISLPPERIVKDSFSLLPLNEQGWLVRPQGGDALTLLKIGSMPDGTHAIMAWSIPIPSDVTDQDFSDFAELKLKSTLKMENSKRYEVLRHDVQKAGSQIMDCVKVRNTVRDHEARKITKTPGPMIMDTLCWVCKHSDGKNAVIVGYSDRFYAGHEDSAFEEKAETVFNGLKYVVR